MLAACGTSSSETGAAERGAGGAASFPSSESPAVHVHGIWNRALLTDEHLHVVYTGATAAGWARFDTIYRYDLAFFDQLGEPVEPFPAP